MSKEFKKIVVVPRGTDIAPKVPKHDINAPVNIFLQDYLPAGTKPFDPRTDDLPVPMATKKLTLYNTNAGHHKQWSIWEDPVKCGFWTEWGPIGKTQQRKFFPMSSGAQLSKTVNMLIRAKKAKGYRLA